MQGSRAWRSSRPASPILPASNPPVQLTPVTTDAVPKRRTRSLSFASFFNKLLPNNRPERGGTLRRIGFWEPQSGTVSPSPPRAGRTGSRRRRRSDSIASSSWNLPISAVGNADTLPDTRGYPRSPVSGLRLREDGHGNDRSGGNAKPELDDIDYLDAVLDKVQSQQTAEPYTGIGTDPKEFFSTKRMARRLRRNLKERGDFLGVQGINPQTGELDVLTPTSSSQSKSSSQELKRAAQKTTPADDTAYTGAQYAGLSLGQLQKEQQKWNRDESKKDSIRAFQRRVRWRKHNNEWSSAAEPELSPIESLRSDQFSSAGVSTAQGVHDVEAPSHGRSERTASNMGILANENQAAGRRGPSIEPTRHSSDTVIHTPRRRSSGRTSPSISLHKDSIEVIRTSSAIRHTEREREGNNIEDPFSPQPSRTIRRKPHRIGDLINKPPISGPTSLINTSHATNRSYPTDESPFLGIGAASATVTVALRRKPAVPPSSPTIEIGMADLSHPIIKPETETRVRGNQEAPGKEIAPENMSLAERHPRVPSSDIKPSAMVDTRNPEMATAVSSLSKTETTDSQVAPLIPQKLHPSSNDVCQNNGKRIEDPSGQLIDISAQPVPVITAKSANNQARSLEFRMEIEPMNDWANVLVGDVEIFGQGPKSRTKTVAENKGIDTAESVCIRTTTTIGSVHNPPDHAQAITTPHFDVTPAVFKGRPATPTSIPSIGPTANWTSSGSGEPPARISGNGFDLLDSPPRLPRSTWPSITSPTAPRCSRPTTTTAPPGNATTSDRQLTPTKVRCERLCRRASGDPKVAVAQAEIDGIGMETQDALMKGREGVSTAIASPATTSTRRRRYSCSSPTTRSPPSEPGQEDHQINELIAQEAARYALVKYDAAAASIVQVPPGGTGSASTSAPAPARDARGWATKRRLFDDGGDIDDLSRKRPRVRRVVRFSPAGAPQGTPQGVQKGALQDSPLGMPLGTPPGTKRPIEAVERFCWAYWDIVKPVFDTASPISVRYSRSQSTWMDCGIYMLAICFVLSVVLAGFWAIKCFLAVWSILKALVKGFVLLVDI